MSGDYLLGSEPAELERLGFQHRVWAESAHAVWRRAGFGPDMTILDLGAGPGFASFDLVELVGPRGRVLAVEPAERFVAHLEAEKRNRRLSNLEIREACAESLALPAASLDGAYARWLFCFLPEPAPVLALLFESLRPGGVLVIQDYVNYPALTLAPRSPALDRVVVAAIESWRRSGGDLEIGARLPGLLLGAGFEVREIVAQCRAARPGSALWDWPKGFFHGYCHRLVEMGLLDEAERLAFEREWLERERQPGSFFLTPLVVDLVACRPR